MRNRSFAVLAVVLGLVVGVRSQMQSLSQKDSFGAAKLSAKETHEILDGVEQSAYDTPDSWEAELRLRRVNLGDTPGIVVQGTSMLCGGTGNCQTWVFRKTSDRWVSMMAGDQAPIASGFEFGTTFTHGIRDFTITSNSSAAASKRVTLKFDGKFYQAQQN
jgi:hypothetical protein